MSLPKGCDVIQADVAPTLGAMDGGGFALIHADPPYHKVLNENWDNEHSSVDEFLEWLGREADQWSRVLAPNGSLYCWAWPRIADLVSVNVIRPRLHVLNRVRWDKTDDPSGYHNKCSKEALRSYRPASETVIFAEHKSADLASLGLPGYADACASLRGFIFEPLRAYLDDERRAAGVSHADVEAGLGNQMATHYFSRSQWCLPTPQNYDKMRRLFNRRGGSALLRREYEDLRREYEDLRREYEDLRREYEDLRREYEDLRRPFSVDKARPYTDVWRHPAPLAAPGRHPAEKPVEMMRDIVRASSRPGDLCLDLYAGSGSFSAACIDLGRRVVAVERNADWCRVIKARVERHWHAAGGPPHPMAAAGVNGPLFRGGATNHPRPGPPGQAGRT